MLPMGNTAWTAECLPLGPLVSSLAGGTAVHGLGWSSQGTDPTASEGQAFFFFFGRVHGPPLLWGQQSPTFSLHLPLL